MNNLEFNLDILSLHKMLFIYNAVLNGWIVKKLSDNNFEFATFFYPGFEDLLSRQPSVKISSKKNWFGQRFSNISLKSANNVMANYL